MDGILNINKPQGMTSFGAVARVKRLTGERRVGHAGTLDPEASGVLPICLGKGTKITGFLADTTKVYRAEIELGRATDTYDSSGRTTQRGDPSGISREQCQTALIAFQGRIQQTPPMYSALKYRGRRLYELARAGIQVERPSRPVRIDRLELSDWQPPLATVEVVCGKGTYIRSLAHDLGQVLGCGATLKSLARLRCGLFDIKDSVSLTELEDAARYGYWHNFVYPVDIAFLDWAAIVVSKATEQQVRNGQSLVLESKTSGREIAFSRERPSADSPSQNRCRVYDLDGCFLGVLRFHPESRQWHPERVFR
ncbi:MAG: tRNA pseudouridine(55) synthase TruB [Dehalococcoidia bacterium]